MIHQKNSVTEVKRTGSLFFLHKGTERSNPLTPLSSIYLLHLSDTEAVRGTFEAGDEWFVCVCAFACPIHILK